MASGIPVGRILSRLDSFYEADDAASAEKLLAHWAAEAVSVGDRYGLLQMQNERMGLYRKAGNGPKAEECAQNTVELVRELSLADSVSGATCLVNCATVFDAFGKPEKALALFAAVRPVFERELPEDDFRLGSFWNNYATALKDAGAYSEALDSYRKALAVVKRIPHSEGEAAETLLNVADTLVAQLGPEEACEQTDAYVQRAQELLDTPDLPRTGRYAFICRKCAPVFEYYGWFVYAKELNERADTIYEGA